MVNNISYRPILTGFVFFAFLSPLVNNLEEKGKEENSVHGWFWVLTGS